MKHIMDAAEAGKFLTTDELQDKLSYGADVSKSAVLCSLRFLKRWGFLTKESRGNMPAVIKPTGKAYPMFRPRF